MMHPSSHFAAPGLEHAALMSATAPERYIYPGRSGHMYSSGHHHHYDVMVRVGCRNEGVARLRPGARCAKVCTRWKTLLPMTTLFFRLPSPGLRRSSGNGPSSLKASTGYGRSRERRPSHRR
jgi:hypothetical protein